MASRPPCITATPTTTGSNCRSTPAELDGYFKSRAFAENPVGVTYDPEELCRRYEAGEAMADLLRNPPFPAGKTPWDMLASH